MSKSSPDRELRLLELEPSPLETDGLSTQIGTLHNVGSSEGAHRITHYLVKTQQISSYIFTGFLGIHWFTTGIFPLFGDAEATDSSLLLSRVIYQNDVIEPCLVLGSVGAHIVSGVALRIIRRVKQYNKYGRVIWFRDLGILQGSGYLLIPMVAIHFSIVRLLPLIRDGGSESIGIGFLAHGFVQLKYLSWFMYPALAIVGTFHVAQGWARWKGYPKNWKSRVVCLATVVSGVWLTSVIRISRIGRAVGHLGRHYDDFYNAILSLSSVA
ncbi:hypothetical protein TWF730_007173 [Orbilia blumenaviensis]|uniref:Mitochondrial adapter protein MCP1 transmembrane domain-containing protein n=1 Tax=Orbilia blumenaviensis TaxID=1796055 RepID=A0AAV9V6Z4_9PEZI